MQNKQVKIQVYTKLGLIGGILISGILCILGVLFIVFVDGGLPAGIIFIGFAFVILAIMLFQPNFWIAFSNESLMVQTIFGRIKKKEDWSNLKHIYIKELSPGRNAGNYIIFNFSENEEELISTKDAWETDHIIFLEYTPKREELLKQYTDVPIIDKRMSAK